MKKITFLFLLLGCMFITHSNASISNTMFVCPTPTGITVTNITTTGASITWAAGSSTAWEILVLEEGVAVPTSTTAGTPVADTPAYTATLNAGSFYRIYVRANCGTEFSNWSTVTNFYTPCTAISLFTESFDTTTTSLPACWAAVMNGDGISASASAKVVSANAFSGTKSVQLSNGNSATTANVMLVSPVLDNLSAGTHRLKFYAKSSSATSSIQVGTVTGNGSDAAFTLLESFAPTSVYNEFLADFTVYAGSDTQIAIRNTSPTYTTIYLDDIRWEVTPLCGDVTAVSVPVTAPNTATVTWMAPAGQSAWDVVYGASTVTDPSTLTPISPAVTTTPETTLSELTENTAYKVWVRSACGGTEGNGAWIGPINFTTACASVATFNENFETTTGEALPNCWSKILNGASLHTSAYIRTVGSGAYAGSRAVQMNNYSSGADSNMILVSPNLGTLATGTHRVKFYAKSSGAVGSIELGTLSTATNQAEFTYFETVALTNTYAEFIVDFTTYEGTDTYIGIRHSSSANNSVYLDNIRWEESPACADVTNIHVNSTTPDSVTLSWDAHDGETQWDIVYGDTTVTDPTTLTPISPAPTTNNGALVTGLAESTTYNVWVRSVCGPGANGVWIGPLSVTSACLAVTSFDENFDTTDVSTDEFALPNCWSAIIAGETASATSYAKISNILPHSGTQMIRINNTNSGEEARVMLVSPNLSNLSAATHRLRFFAFGDAAKIDVGTLDNNTDGAVFTSLQPITLTSQYAEYIIDFSVYSGSDSYIALRNISVNDYTSAYIDDIIWEEIPACPDVTNITVTDVTTTMATINWLAGNGETNWQVAYAPSTVTDPASATVSELLSDTNLPLDELMVSTSYNVWVRSVCGEDNGNWIGPVAFNTECDAVASFTENFDSVEYPALPLCWSKIVADAMVNSFVGVTPYSFSSAPNSAQLYGDYSGTSSRIILISPPVTTLASGDYELKFKATGSLPLEIGTLNGNTTEATFTVFETVTLTDSNTLPLFTVDFSTYTGTDTYIGFRLKTSNENAYANVDDVSWAPSLSSGSFNKEKFSYYPNPVKDVLTIKYAENITSVAVFNLLGQKVMESNAGSTSVQLDMSDLSSGSYIVKVASNDQVKSIKVIKQ